MSDRVTNPAGVLTRSGAARFAAKLAEEQREQEIRDALRVSLLSTCQRDRSAVPAVAQLLGVDDATVYRYADGTLPCRVVTDFLRLLDTIIAAKGEHNPAGRELAKLVQRRYLDAREPEHASPSVVKATAGDMAEVVGITIRQLLRAVSHESDGGESFCGGSDGFLRRILHERCALSLWGRE